MVTGLLRTRFSPAESPLVRAVLVFGGLLTACADDDGNGDDTMEQDEVSSHADWSGNTPCAHGTRVGDIAIHVKRAQNDQPAFTAIQGVVLDGVEPRTVPEVVQTMGECQLLRTPTFFCDPPCASGQVCDATGTCIPEPLPRSVGTVAIRGLDIPVTMEPGPSNFYTNPPGLPHPAFAPNASLQLDAAGGDFEAFSLRGAGVGEVVSSMQMVTVQEGQPVALTWTAAGGKAGVHIKLNINQHGGTPSWVECVTADTGSFEIPSALVDELFSAGLSGYPTVWITRRTVDSATIGAGCVEFVVDSEYALQVEVPGVTSCMSDEDCPEGQTCQADLTCG